jgi:hypothetical protein
LCRSRPSGLSSYDSLGEIAAEVVFTYSDEAAVDDGRQQPGAHPAPDRRLRALEFDGHIVHRQKAPADHFAGTSLNFLVTAVEPDLVVPPRGACEREVTSSIEPNPLRTELGAVWLGGVADGREPEAHSQRTPQNLLLADSFLIGQLA